MDSKGDFNMVRSKLERRGQGDREEGIHEFNTFIEKCNLVDVSLVGRKFTWIGPENKRSKLDRFLVDEEWFQAKEDLVLSGSNRNVSDHIAILLGNSSFNWGPKPFKCINAWFSNKECLKVIEQSIAEGKLKRKSLSVLLRKVKAALKGWSKSREDLEPRITKLEEKINEIERMGDVGDMDMQVLEELKQAKLEYWECLKLQEEIWSQKARMTWLKQGDFNTKFFHRVVKMRAKRNLIRGINVGLNVMADPEKIRQRAVRLLSTTIQGEREKLGTDIES
ncbi:hypothetical protein V6N13_054455 [Hibiscus sabdariffa]